MLSYYCVPRFKVVTFCKKGECSLSQAIETTCRSSYYGIGLISVRKSTRQFILLRVHIAINDVSPSASLDIHLVDSTKQYLQTIYMSKIYLRKSDENGSVSSGQCHDLGSKSSGPAIGYQMLAKCFQFVFIPVISYCILIL